MTEEMQKTKDCLQIDRTESEDYVGVQTVIGISHESLVEVNLSSEMLLETIMSRGNMNAAYKRVMSNRGSGGVDNMGLDELLPYLLYTTGRNPDGNMAEFQSVPVGVRLYPVWKI